MEKKIVSAITLTLLLTSLLTLAFNIQLVKASGTIYIRADGSVDPSTAPITVVGNVTYVLTDHIYDSSVVVERDNIVVDGAGYTLQGYGSGTGIKLLGRTNVTIKNTNIIGFWGGYDIWLSSSSNNSIAGNKITNNVGGIYLGYSSNYNSIAENKITNNSYGAYLDSSSNNNSVSGNKITANIWEGIWISSSSNNSLSGNDVTANIVNGIELDSFNNSSLSGNNITNNECGIVFLSSCNDNSVSGNNMTNNEYGIQFGSSSNNRIYHNHFINNTSQVFVNDELANVWDDGYPSGGNYWSDYVGVDVKSGPGQDLPGSDCIGDTPYIIDANNKDRYPLMNPRALTANFTWSPPMPRATKTVTFNASSSTPNTGTIVSYTWDFGDGNITTTTNPTITHRYAGPKRYNVTLTVLNSVGLTGSITKSVKIMNVADINMDGKVDIIDVAMVAGAFGSYPSRPKWNPACDMNSDNRIDIYDVAYVAHYFGWHDP